MVCVACSAGYSILYRIKDDVDEQREEIEDEEITTKNRRREEERKNDVQS
jgi:hypothetical protein